MKMSEAPASTRRSSLRNSALSRSSMRSMATKLDQNKVDSVMASGRKSLVNTMILSDAAEAQAQSKDAPRVLTLRGCWIGFPVTNNTKALFVMMVMFTVITLGQYFAADAVGSQALKADVVSMGVDAISYFGNICDHNGIHRYGSDWGRRRIYQNRGHYCHHLRRPGTHI
mmetsp:Transcript_2560/g.5917  ORF Transcript_2560/g.5917 Transcript_2560/m.5917 type:complete len:170 (+) Transcript_2560:283-792(+)